MYRGHFSVITLSQSEDHITQTCLQPPSMRHYYGRWFKLSACNVNVTLAASDDRESTDLLVIVALQDQSQDQ